MESRLERACPMSPSPSVSPQWIVGWISERPGVEKKQIVVCSANPWPSYSSHVIEQGKTIDIWPRGTPKQMYFWDTAPDLGPCFPLQQHVLNCMVGAGGTLLCCLVLPEPYVSSYLPLCTDPFSFLHVSPHCCLDILTLAVKAITTHLSLPSLIFSQPHFYSEKNMVSCGLQLPSS